MILTLRGSALLLGLCAFGGAVACGSDGVTGGAAAPDPDRLPRPILLVLDADAGLTVLDPEAGRVLRRVTLGGSGRALAASPDGRRGFVPGLRVGGGALHEIDLVFGRLSGSLPAALGLSDVASDRDGHLWLAVGFSPNADPLDHPTGSGTVLELDPDDGRELARIGTPVLVRTVDLLEPAGLVVGVGADELIIIDTRAKGLRSRVSLGSPGQDVAVSADENLAYVTDDQGRLIELDATGSRILRTAELAVGPPSETFPNRPEVGGPDEVLVASAASRELIAVDRSTFQVTRRITLDGVPSDLELTSDGSEVYVALGDAGEIVVIERAGFAEVGRLVVGGTPIALAWVSAGGGGVPQPPARVEPRLPRP